MDRITHSINRDNLQPGDHIYAYRAIYTFSHHGIYIGDGKVIHFTAKEKQIFSSSGQASYSNCSTSSDCGLGKGGIICSCLDCFLRDRSLRRYKYEVSTSRYLSRVRGGTCTTAVSDDSNTVVHRAMYILRHGFGNYDLVKNNCEDFALYCKTGLVPSNNLVAGRSGQIASVGLPLVPLFLTSRGFKCLGNDIGQRTDVVKVEVEDLHERMGWEKCLEEETGVNDEDETGASDDANQ